MSSNKGTIALPQTPSVRFSHNTMVDEGIDTLREEINILFHKMTKLNPNGRQRKWSRNWASDRSRVCSERRFASTIRCYHRRYGDRAQKFRPPCIFIRSHLLSVTIATAGAAPRDSRLFYPQDKETVAQFLADTGAEVSVVSLVINERRNIKTAPTLKVANKFEIRSYGK